MKFAARTMVGVGLTLLCASPTLAQQSAMMPPGSPVIINTLLATVTQVAGPEANPGLPYSRQLRRISCYNPNAAAVYVQLFNALAANVVLGTTAANDVLPLAASSSGGWAEPSGDSYPNGIAVAATTTATGNTAPGAGLSCSFSVF